MSKLKQKAARSSSKNQFREADSRDNRNFIIVLVIATLALMGLLYYLAS